MFCFGIDGVNEITNVPSCKYHKHLIFLVLLDPGGDLNDIVKLNIFLTDLSHFPTVNEIMAQYFSVPYPARAALGIKELPRGAQVEMDGVLVKEAHPQ
jgi:enamine deaminase RidA (YjgF/YER057c/UK114 family)